MLSRDFYVSNLREVAEGGKLGAAGAETTTNRKHVTLQVQRAISFLNLKIYNISINMTI